MSFWISAAAMIIFCALCWFFNRMEKPWASSLASLFIFAALSAMIFIEGLPVRAKSFLAIGIIGSVIGVTTLRNLGAEWKWVAAVVGTMSIIGMYDGAFIAFRLLGGVALLALVGWTFWLHGYAKGRSEEHASPTQGSEFFPPPEH